MPKNILIVDELANMRMLLGKELSKNKKLFVLTESDAHDAIETLNRPDIELMITEIQLPDMKIIDFIKYVRKNNFNKPIFILSTKFTQELVINLKKLNVTNFFTKPPDIPKIEAKIAEILNL